MPPLIFFLRHFFHAAFSPLFADFCRVAADISSFSCRRHAALRASATLRCYRCAMLTLMRSAFVNDCCRARLIDAQLLYRAVERCRHFSARYAAAVLRYDNDDAHDKIIHDAR